MRFIAGLAIGIVLGAGVAVHAVGSWDTGKTVMSSSRTYHMGYAAGASDMLDTVVDINREGSSQAASLMFAKQARCLEGKAAGSLGRFTDWAERLWIGKDTQAASILLVHACE